MPVYEFRCTKCNQKFEELTPWSKIDEVVCPKCGSSEVKKLLSRFAARSSDSQGCSTSLGSGCGSCAGGNCSTCHH